MSIHVHVYIEDIDRQLAVVFITCANTSNESSDESAHLCSLPRAFATCIQNIYIFTVNPFLHVRRA